MKYKTAINSYCFLYFLLPVLNLAYFWNHFCRKLPLFNVLHHVCLSSKTCNSKWWIENFTKLKGPFRDPQPHSPIFHQKVELFTSVETFNVCVQNISCKFICLRGNNGRIGHLSCRHGKYNIVAYATSAMQYNTLYA